ncbi:hypothetical protein E2986_12315 [Frieseomelitta varia]|uniref:Uncharacterized protein n=1 Tax=Frieseomelitta varia TaxID=561572 RepID=A0A833RXD2_9HYME|nr:hypothetical protein E2986_12315 [Frieseomelitta varia]
MYTAILLSLSARTRALQSLRSSSKVAQIALRDNEQFLRPRRRIQRILTEGKAVDCRAYVILIANGYLTAEFLQYTERYLMR